MANKMGQSIREKVNTRMTALATDQSNDPSASVVTGVGLAAS